MRSWSLCGVFCEKIRRTYGTVLVAWIGELSILFLISFSYHLLICPFFTTDTCGKLLFSFDSQALFWTWCSRYFIITTIRIKTRRNSITPMTETDTTIGTKWGGVVRVWGTSMAEGVTEIIEMELWGGWESVVVAVTGVKAEDIWEGKIVADSVGRPSTCHINTYIIH